MKKEIFTISIIFILILVGFSGCLNESTVSTLASQMEEKYNSISDYRATVNYTTYSEYYREYIKTIKKPDKLRYEYTTPEYKEGDLDIINGNTEWRYDKSKNRAYQHSCNVNIGEESLKTPDFLNYLLFLMNNFDIKQLDDETLGEFNTTVLEITPNIQTTFSKLKYWLDKETLFPIKWEIYDQNGNIRLTQQITSFDINIGISDNEFELPENAEIITQMDWVFPTTIEEAEDAVGFSILFPTYLPENYTLNEEYLIGGGSIRRSGSEYQINYFQNSLMRQVCENVETIWIRYPRNDSYAEIISSATGEVLAITKNSTGQLPDDASGDIEFETYTFDIEFRQAIEDIFESEYLPKNNPVEVDINDVKGEYWIGKDTGQYGEVVYQRACLSWSLNEYWLILTTGGDALLDSDEMVKIAESISI